MHLLTLLHQLPDLVILATVVLTVVSVVVLAPLAARLLHLPESEKRDEAAFEACKGIIAMIGVVLAFSLVQVNVNLRSAETMVGREAAALAAADRIMLRYGTQATAELRPLLAEYGRSRVNQEWPTMAHGERHPAVDERYTAVSRAARVIQPVDRRQQTMFAELLRTLDDLAETRELLLQDSEIELPEFFWITTSALLGLMVLTAALARATLARAVGLGAAAAAASTLLAFVIIMDQPFRGETSVNPAPIRKVLELNSRRV